MTVAGGLPPFQQFLEANRATVYRFLTVAVGPLDADDAFQETFLAALRAYPRVREPDKLDRWILRSRAARRSTTTAAPGAVRPPPTGCPTTRCTTPSRTDLDDPLWRAVRALPARQRVAVVHRHVLDRPYGEIAELMGCTEETARANVYQGMKRLRELMT